MWTVCVIVSDGDVRNLSEGVYNISDMRKICVQENQVTSNRTFSHDLLGKLVVS